MFWKPRIHNRLSDDACKRIYHSYYLKVYAFVRLVLGNDHSAKAITIDTLLQVCQNTDGYTRSALFAAIRHITADKCLEHVKKDSQRRIYYEDYLANDENSKILLDTDFKNALLLVMELNVLRKLSAEDHDEQMLKSPMVSELRDLARVDHFSHWESFKQQLDGVTIYKMNYVGKAAVALAVAAMAIVIIAPVVHSVFIQRQYANTSAVPPVIEQYFATGNEPKFILPNDLVIKLDSIPDGALIAYGVPFRKKDSILVYEPLVARRQTQEQGMNILSVPPTRQYQIRLADGSMVWLGASSELHFPDNFSGNERLVTMEGQAFFEIETNKKKPFTVKLINGVSVTALGTSFNILAYNGNDHISTALFEGKLMVKANSRDFVMLQPGQEAVLKKGNLTGIKKCMEEQAMAWKKGWFDFDDKSIKEIMEEIRHWYNVKVVYGRKIPDSKFGLRIHRSKPLPELIKSISERIGVPIKLTSDTLIVSPE